MSRTLRTLELYNKNLKNFSVSSFNLNVQSSIKLQKEKKIIQQVLEINLQNYSGSSYEKNLFEFLRFSRIKVLSLSHPVDNVKTQTLEKNKLETVKVEALQLYDFTELQQFQSIGNFLSLRAPYLHKIFSNLRVKTN